MKLMVRALLLIGLVFVTACSKEQNGEVPPAIAMAPDATGYYCGMLLAEHPGPKGQILLASDDKPVWFSSVRDAFTFLSLPEESKEIAAVYVSDMAKATSWEKPGSINWILAEKAIYVIESNRAGGMGGPEAVPFGDEAAAKTFVGEHGGRIVGLADAKAAMTESKPN